MRRLAFLLIPAVAVAIAVDDRAVRIVTSPATNIGDAPTTTTTAPPAPTTTTTVAAPPPTTTTTAPPVDTPEPTPTPEPAPRWAPDDAELFEKFDDAKPWLGLNEPMGTWQGCTPPTTPTGPWVCTFDEPAAE